MTWLADLKCGDPRCGCTGNPPPSDWNPTGPYTGMGLDMSGPTRRIQGGIWYSDAGPEETDVTYTYSNDVTFPTGVRYLGPDEEIVDMGGGEYVIRRRNT